MVKNPLLLKQLDSCQCFVDAYGKYQCIKCEYNNLSNDDKGLYVLSSNNMYAMLVKEYGLDTDAD